MKVCNNCSVGIEYECNEGGYIISNDYLIYNSFLYESEDFFKFKYCPNCGRKIDWKRIEEDIEYVRKNR